MAIALPKFYKSIDIEYVVGLPSGWRHLSELLYAGLPQGLNMLTDPMGVDMDESIIFRHPALHFNVGYPGAQAVLQGSAGPDGLLMYRGAIPDTFRYSMRRYWSFSQGSRYFDTMLGDPTPSELSDFKFLAEKLPLHDQIEQATSDPTCPYPDIGVNIPYIDQNVVYGPSTSPPLSLGPGDLTAIGRATDLVDYMDPSMPTEDAFRYCFSLGLDLSSRAASWPVGPFQTALPQVAAASGKHLVVVGGQQVVVGLKGSNYRWESGWMHASGVESITQNIAGTAASAIDPRFRYLVNGTDNTMWQAYLQGGHAAMPTAEWSGIPGIWSMSLTRHGYIDYAFDYAGFRRKNPYEISDPVNDWAQNAGVQCVYNYYSPNFEEMVIHNRTSDARLLPNFYQTIAMSGDPANATFPFCPTANFITHPDEPHNFYGIGDTVPYYMNYGGFLAPGTSEPMGSLPLPLDFNAIRVTDGPSNSYLTRVSNTNIAALDNDYKARLDGLQRHIGLSSILVRNNGPIMNHHNAMEQMNEAAPENFPYYAEIHFDTPASAGPLQDHIFDIIEEYHAAELKTQLGPYAEMDQILYEIMKAEILEYYNYDYLFPDSTSPMSAQISEPLGSFYHVSVPTLLHDNLYDVTATTPWTVKGVTGSYAYSPADPSPVTSAQSIVGTDWLYTFVAAHGSLQEMPLSEQPDVTVRSAVNNIDIGNMFQMGYRMSMGAYKWNNFEQAPTKQNCFIGQTNSNFVAKALPYAATMGGIAGTPPLDGDLYPGPIAKGQAQGQIIGRGFAKITQDSIIGASDAANWYPEMKDGIPPFDTVNVPDVFKHVPLAWQRWIGLHARTYRQILEGKTAHSEIICFRIDKKMETSPANWKTIQSFYIPWDGKNPSIKYIDTQVMYGETYSYHVYAYHLVAASTYNYEGPCSIEGATWHKYNNRLWPVLFGDPPKFGPGSEDTPQLARLAGKRYSDNYPPPPWYPGSPPLNATACGQMDSHMCIWGDIGAGPGASTGRGSAPWAGGTDRRNFIISDVRTVEKFPHPSTPGVNKWMMYVPAYADMDTTLPMKCSVYQAGPMEGNYFKGDKDGPWGSGNWENIVPWADWDPATDGPGPVNFGTDKGTFPPSSGLDISSVLTMSGLANYADPAIYGPNRIDVDEFCLTLEAELNKSVGTYHTSVANPDANAVLYNYDVMPGAPISFPTDAYYKDQFRVRPLFYESSGGAHGAPGNFCKILIIRVGVLEDWRDNTKSMGHFFHDPDGIKAFFDNLHQFARGASVTSGAPGTYASYPSGHWNQGTLQTVPRGHLGGDSAPFPDAAMIIAGSAPGILSTNSKAAVFNQFFSLAKLTLMGASGGANGEAAPKYACTEIGFEFWDGPFGSAPATPAPGTLSLSPEGSGVVNCFPLLKIMSTLYTSIGQTTIKDLPPVPPDVRMYPEIDNPSKMQILLAQPRYKKRLMPIAIEDNDEAMFAQMRSGQGIPDYEGILFGADDAKIEFEVYRTEDPPTSYRDFSGKRLYLLDTVTPAGDNVEAASIKDTIKPNKTYYYCYRTIDKNGYMSVPTTVLRVMMVDDNGRIFPIIEPFKIERPETRSAEKPFRRYLEIDASIAERLVNHAAGSSAGDPLIPPSAGVTLGNQIFDSGNTFKIRIIGKDTGKKLDLNLNFNMGRIRNPKIEEN